MISQYILKSYFDWFFVLGSMHRATSLTQCAFQVSSFVVLIRYEITKRAKTVYSIRRDAITGGLYAVVFLVYQIKRSIQLRNVHMAPYSWCNETHGPGGRGVYCLWLPLSKVWLSIAVRLVTCPTKNTNMLLVVCKELHDLLRWVVDTPSSVRHIGWRIHHPPQ